LLHLLLASVVITALLLLALSSFRLRQRLLAGVLLTAALVLTVIVAVVAFQQNALAPQLDTAQLSLRLDAMHKTARGWRLEGQVENLGTQDVSSMTLAVIALDCDQQDQCRAVARREFDLLLNVPAGKGYPLRQALDALPVSVEGELSWRLEAVSVLGYADQR